MRRRGADLQGLEVGNAWALRDPRAPHTNWLVGDHPAIPADSLRFLRHLGHPAGPEAAANLAVKWFVHDPADPPEWGQAKPASVGRTLSLLAGAGAFELCFGRGEDEAVVVLEEPGDFALWGPGLAHSWRVLAPSVVLTVRWELVGGVTPAFASPTASNAGRAE
ncbi:MAG: hypothetical protein VKN83_07535 [Cyanobacteriota bacterium]|nr:hypothetical protein [Cyanobacteriota bacterium]